MATSPLTTKTVQLKLVYLLLGAGVLFGVGGAIGGVVAAVAMKVIGKGVSTATAAPVPKPRYTRLEFNDAVVGKTTDEVLQLMGKPGGTTGTHPENGTWYYHNICYDPITGKSDQNTIVEFHRNIAVKTY